MTHEPTMLDLLCGQDEVWRGNDYVVYRLDEMTTSHRANLLRWLERNAERLKDAAEVEFCLGGPNVTGEAALDDYDAAAGRMLEQEPREWLDEQPLVRRLRDLVAVDAEHAA